MFVGREKEIDKLNDLYQDNQFQFVVIYGRRRVGKTSLINEFLKDKKSVYYMAVEGTRNENLIGLSNAMLASSMSGIDFPTFEDFEKMLQYVDELCLHHSEERFIFAIDEYPYLAASYPAITSLLQRHIDQCWKKSNLFLILCGSSMSFMEEQILGYKSPLYGRRTAQFKLRPFSFFDARKMLDHYSLEDQAILYGVTGGIPEYLSRIQPSKSLDQNLIDLFFDESGRLFEEPTNLLKQELREPASYHSILSAIAGGASRLNEITTKTGLASGGCSNQITSLISLGIIKREIPITEKKTSRKTIYRLEDNMFVFWYRFVRPNTSGIIRGAGEMIYEKLVKPQLNDFMGHIFEEICEQYLYLPNIYVSLPFMLGNVGRWWGNNSQKRRQEEIDIMSFYQDEALLCECKWRNELTDKSIIEQLVVKGEMFHYPKKYFMIFSKSGFTQAAKDYAMQNSNISLITLEEMV